MVAEMTPWIDDDGMDWRRRSICVITCAAMGEGCVGYDLMKNIKKNGGSAIWI